MQKNIRYVMRYKHLLKRAGYVFLLIFSMAVHAKVEILDRISVVVDEDVILQSELNERIQMIKDSLLAEKKPLPPEDMLHSQIIERMIVESLQIQVAERAGVRVSDEELNDAMTRVAAQNNMNLLQFRKAVEADGMSYEGMREQIKREMMISHVQRGMMRNRIKITEQEVKNFLDSEMGAMLTADEYRFGHILLPLSSNPSSSEVRQVKKKADDLLKRINQGADFHSMAVQHSSGQNALKGGDLGWRKAAQLPTLFSGIANEMQPGEVRGPVKTGSGFHLIKLLERRGAQAQGQIAQTQVRHILVQPSEIRSIEEARDLAHTLRQEIVDGADFGEIARLHSDDPGSALSGGDLGWNQAGTFVPEFEAVMHASLPHHISDVFQTEHGFHFLEVTGRRIEDFSEEFRMSQAENYIFRQKFDEEVDNWIREMREEAFVEIRH
ncbi:MAG: peptidylprolyl isomerase [Gammaproteobacteria bacterium]|nr:peptidylprolyl isomerase [Gammaproteobacteria bacterium]